MGKFFLCLISLLVSLPCFSQFNSRTRLSPLAGISLEKVGSEQIRVFPLVGMSPETMGREQIQNSDLTNLMKATVRKITIFLRPGACYFPPHFHKLLC